MKNWAPLLIVVVFIALLAVLFGPGIYRGIKLRGSVSGLLSAVREGRTTDIVAFIEPSQQQQAERLIQRYVPADYNQSIGSLRLSRTISEADAKAVTIVTMRIKQGDLVGIYQGQLVWHYTGGHWEWDFLASGGAEFSPSGEPAWVRLSDLMPRAEQL